MMQAVASVRRIRQRTRDLATPPVETTVEIKRKYRVNGTRNTNGPARGNDNNGGYTSRNTTATYLRIAMQVDRKVHVNVGTAAVQAEADGGVIAMTERTATADAITVGTSLSTAGMTAPFTTRTRKVTTRTMLMLHKSVPNMSLFLKRGASKFRELREKPI